jgi:hypothetical protein
VKFKGEGAADAGGPYRECLTQSFEDAFSPSLDLFIPCGNAEANIGVNEDLFVPNPKYERAFDQIV